MPARPPKPHARLATPSQPTPEIDRFRAQHLALESRAILTKHGRAQVVVDEQESPLAWLARRRGRGGRALIAPHQLQAGERLRADFTLAQLMPRTTSNWASPLVSNSGTGDSAMNATDAMVAARQRVHLALDAVGPEMSGLLLDVCCFLKRLDDVERERVWPARSAKLVLQIALDRLARHYGYAGEARGRARGQVRTWVEERETFRVE